MKIILDYILQFVTLDKAEIDLFTSYLTSKKIKSNQIIFNKGSVCNSLFFVVSGAARSYFLNNEGMEYTWKFHFNDTDATFENLFLVDYQSFLTQTPSFLSFEAINDLEVIELRYESL